jgi:hypothetical protein
LSQGLNSGVSNWLGYKYVTGMGGQQAPQNSQFGPWGGGYQFPQQDNGQIWIQPRRP